MRFRYIRYLGLLRPWTQVKPSRLLQAGRFAAALLIAAAALLAASAVAYAADYAPRFTAVFGDRGSSFPARSPGRMDGGGVWDSFRPVESKNNQPRKVEIGTNPHNGSDIAMVSGERVYPIYGGVVASVNRDLSRQMGSVTIHHDVDGDGKPDGIYVSYVHISPAGTAANGLRAGDYVTPSTIIGFVDVERRFPPHLHIMAVDRASSTGARTLPLYKYFRYTTAASWNGGADLDFISADAMDGNMLYISAYSATDNPVTNSYDRNLPAKVELHYKIGSKGSWKASALPFRLYNESTGRYAIDLQKATGARQGQTVYYYVSAVRSSDPTFPSSFGYRHAVWPPYYAKPDRVLYTAGNGTRADAIARSAVIR